MKQIYEISKMNLNLNSGERILWKIEKEKKGKRIKKIVIYAKLDKRNNMANILFPLNILNKTSENLSNMYISLSIVFLK